MDAALNIERSGLLTQVPSATALQWMIDAIGHGGI
jgi:hypothetical protein